ncbi:insulinase family protein [Streptomyces mirabilis]|nr:insulinase family protein [Streptomyces mirabilis]
MTETAAGEIVEARLDNGLRVLVAENPTVDAVAVNLWYGVGSRDESLGRTGLAHLFEHLMFQGSQNVAAGEHMALLESFGADLNATTSFDRTNYFQTVPTRAFELALWLEADRMGGLPDALDQKNLDSQRDVVRNERRERMDNQPYGDAFERMQTLLFPVGHGYHHMPIGSMEDLAAASLDDVRAFFHQHYAPANAVLTIAGNVRTREALDKAALYFDAVDAGDRWHRGQAADLPALEPLDQQIRADVSSRVPADALWCGWRIPADGTEDFDAAAIALRILGGGEQPAGRASDTAQQAGSVDQRLLTTSPAGRPSPCWSWRRSRTPPWPRSRRSWTPSWSASPRKARTRRSSRRPWRRPSGSGWRAPRRSPAWPTRSPGPRVCSAPPTGSPVPSHGSGPSHRSRSAPSPGPGCAPISGPSSSTARSSHDPVGPGAAPGLGAGGSMEVPRRPPQHSALRPAGRPLRPARPAPGGRRSRAGRATGDRTGGP